MSTIAQERAEAGYMLEADEGEAFWLLGMLQTVKIGRADTAGQYGLLEIVVPPGLGSPWHVHPEEDEWFYVLEGELTLLRRRHAHVPDGRRLRVRSEERAAHVHQRRPEPRARWSASRRCSSRDSSERSASPRPRASCRRLPTGRRMSHDSPKSARATAWSSSAPQAHRPDTEAETIRETGVAGRSTGRASLRLACGDTVQ